jgi:hypothetical protein
MNSISRKINMRTIYNSTTKRIMNTIDNCIDPLFPSQNRMVGRIYISNNLANIPASSYMKCIDTNNGNLLDPYRTHMLYIDPASVSSEYSHLCTIENDILVSQPFLDIYDRIFKYSEEESYLTINNSLDITFMISKYSYKDEISCLIEHTDEEAYICMESSLKIPIIVIDTNNIKPVMCNTYRKKDNVCIMKQCVMEEEGYIHECETLYSLIEPPRLVDNGKEGDLTYLEANIRCI